MHLPRSACLSTSLAATIVNCPPQERCRVQVRPQFRGLPACCMCSAATGQSIVRTANSHTLDRQPSWTGAAIRAAAASAAALLFLAHPGPVRADASTDSTSYSTGIVAAETSVLEEENEEALRASRQTPKVCAPSGHGA